MKKSCQLFQNLFMRLAAVLSVFIAIRCLQNAKLLFSLWEYSHFAKTL